MPRNYSSIAAIFHLNSAQCKRARNTIFWGVVFAQTGKNYSTTTRRRRPMWPTNQQNTGRAGKQASRLAKKQHQNQWWVCIFQIFHPVYWGCCCCCFCSRVPCLAKLYRRVGRPHYFIPQFQFISIFPPFHLTHRTWDTICTPHIIFSIAHSRPL